MQYNMNETIAIMGCSERDFGYLIPFFCSSCSKGFQSGSPTHFRVFWAKLGTLQTIIRLIIPNKYFDVIFDGVELSND